RRQVALHRAGRDGRRGRGAWTGRDALDGAGLLEPSQRRVERAVRDPPEEAQRLAQALLQLVAVERLLLEEAEDGELQHEKGLQSQVAIYRFDISRKTIIATPAVHVKLAVRSHGP